MVESGNFIVEDSPGSAGAHNRTARIFQVDSFTDRPFSGNPAEVSLFAGITDGAWTQDVAREMNLVATAFVEKDVTGSGGGI